MRKLTWLFASLLLSAGSGIAGAQGAASGKPAAKPTTVAQIEDYLVAAVGRGFVRTADAMPADKYSFAPTQGNFKGVRTFAEQVKHVAAVNYQMGGALLKEKHPVEFASGGGPDSITTKAEILKFLTGSFEYLRKAVGTINEKTAAEQIPNPEGEGTVSRLEIATRVQWHVNDHYGQLVEYLRMNGIVPPASQS